MANHFSQLAKKSRTNGSLEKIEKEQKKVDILVNVVGQSEPGGPVEIDSTTWQKQFTLNLDTAYFCIKFVIPIMEKNSGGSIVNISSVAGLRYIGKPQVGYSASKAAVVGMSKSLAIEYAKKNININCISPGFIKTVMTDKIEEKFKETIISKIPSARLGEPDDIANAVGFLCSNQSSYINGETLHVNGGMYMA